MKVKVNIAITIVCIILGIILACQYRSIDLNKQVEEMHSKSIEDLMGDIIREKKNNEALSIRLEELKKKEVDLENARGKTNETTRLLSEELERTRIIAGLTDVRGKGVIITISENEASYIDDTNILEVLNELRASDAQAISVNNERIVALSEVRTAGRYIMINGKQMVAPFEIKAIADPEKVEHTLKMMNGIVEKFVETYQLVVNVQKSDNIFIPKVRDDGSVIKTNLLTPVKAG